MSMSEKPWTLGPWSIEWFCAEPQFVEAGPERVCQMWNKMEEQFPNSVNNARLIAAAPELVTALECLLDMQPPPARVEDSLHREAILRGQALLAKIYGKA